MVSSDLAVGAASLLATAASSEPSSLRRLAGLAVQQVNGCSAATVALWRDGEPGCGDVESPGAARADLGAAPRRARAHPGRAGQRGPGQLRRHTGLRAVAGVLGGGPRPGRAILDHAPLPRRPGLLYLVLVRRAAGGDGCGADPAAPNCWWRSAGRPWPPSPTTTRRSAPRSSCATPRTPVPWSIRPRAS